MAQGQMNTYVQTLPQKTVISDRIIMIEPMEQPLVAALGLNSESKFSFVNQPGKLYEWLEDTYSGLSTTGNETNLTSDSDLTSVTVTDGSLFQPGDVLQVDSEFIWVSAVSTNELTVTRDYGGSLSTQATHASDATIYLRSRARLEGASAGDSHYTAPTSNTNCSFILQKTIEISRTDGRIQRYGIPDLLEYEKNKKIKELSRDLSRKPYYGVRGAGSATTPRDAGGFDTFITTNATACSSAALTQKNIEDAVEDCWDNGGNPTLLVCGAWAKRKICSFYEDSVRTTRDETLGGIVINEILTTLGLRLKIVVDRYCPTDHLWILDPEYIGYITIDDLFYEDLAKTKDTSAYGQIVGEYGFVVAHEKAHAVISGFSTSA